MQVDKNALRALTGATAWSLVIGAALPALFNLPLYKNPILLRAILKKAGAFDRLDAIASHTLDKGLTLAITMKSQKVYVGAPISSSNFDEEEKWIAIFPLVSGYRTDKGKLQLTTKYAPIYSKVLTGLTPELAHMAMDDFQIVLPIGEIASVQTFDIDVYAAFQKNGGPPVDETLPAEEQPVEMPDAPKLYNSDEHYFLFTYNGFLAAFSFGAVLAPHVPIYLTLGIFLVAALFASLTIFSEASI